MILIVALILFLASSVASFFGLGGGILYTPFQILLGIPFQQATSTSLFLIFVTSLSATFVFKSSHRVDFSLAFMLEVPTTAGAFAGGILSHYFSQSVMGIILLFLLFTASYFMLFPPSKGFHLCAKIEKPGGKFWWKRTWEGQTLYLDLKCVFPIMFTLGAATSIAGLSGGILKIPIMTLLFSIPVPIAIGSSAFMVGLTASAGFLGHLSVGHVNWKFALLMLVPVFIGAQLGSRLSTHLKAKKLRKYYGIFLLLVSILTAARIFRLLF